MNNTFTFKLRVNFSYFPIHCHESRVGRYCVIMGKASCKRYVMILHGHPTWTVRRYMFSRSMLTETRKRQETQVPSAYTKLPWLTFSLNLTVQFMGLLLHVSELLIPRVYVAHTIIL